MRAVVLPGDGRVEVAERPEPEPGPGAVRVRVHGAGLNRADLLQRAGLYPAPPGSPPDVPGLEFAGVVDATGPGVVAPVPGTAVLGIVGGGAQAELLVVPAAQCAAVPSGLDLERAGGIPEAFVTAHDALRTIAALAPGELVLIHAIGSGVGTAALQLARAFGARVVGTARTADKLERARELGLDHGILVERDVDHADLAVQIVGRAGPPDVVVDLVGGHYVMTDVLAAADRARVVIVGALAGGRANLPILSIMQKRLTLIGTVLRPRTVAEKGAATDAFVRDCGAWLADGTITPVVEAIVPIEDAPVAYDRLASDTTFGKLVLAPGLSR